MYVVKTSLPFRTDQSLHSSSDVRPAQISLAN